MDSLRLTVARDLYRYFGRVDLAALIKAYTRIPGFHFTLVLRITAWIARKRRGVLWPVYVLMRWRLERLMIKYGYQIPHDTAIGDGLYLGHFGGVAINRDAVIGSNGNIALGVIIGQTNRGKHKGAPQIGDRVWIGANAVIVGAITIGDGALIGPGSYVNFDVPSSAVVVGNPGRIVSYRGTACYIENVMPEEDAVGSNSIARK